MIRLYDILKYIFSQREYKKTMFEEHICYNIFSEEYAFKNLSREIEYKFFCKEHPEFIYFQNNFQKLSWRRYKKYCQKILLNWCFPIRYHHNLIKVKPLKYSNGNIFTIKPVYSDREEYYG